MSGGRISRSINVFDKYIENTSTYLKAVVNGITNAERLGILPDEVAHWSGFAAQWAPLCLKYSDKANSRTVGIRNSMLSIIVDTINFDHTNHILDRIAASPMATIEDMGVFNINGGVKARRSRSLPTNRIVDLVTVTFQGIRGGDVMMKCYSPSGQRASIIEGADSVQYLYIVGTTPPTQASLETMKTGISTKAIFTLSLGISSAGQYLYIYFRWYNTKHPERSGSWGELQTTMIV